MACGNAVPYGTAHEDEQSFKELQGPNSAEGCHVGEEELQPFPLIHFPKLKWSQETLLPNFGPQNNWASVAL